MTRTFLKFACAGLLGLTLSAAVMTSPASAQVDDPVATSPIVRDDDDDDFELGWLGLLGLLGLGGLMRRDRHHDEHRHTPMGTTARVEPH